MSRVDVILTEEGTPVLLEINTIPGFTPTSLLPKAAACVGISYEELCERLVLMATTISHLSSSPQKRKRSAKTQRGGNETLLRLCGISRLCGDSKDL